MRIARIISIGDELLSGAVADTNAAYLERELLELGWHPRGVEVVGDEVQAITKAIRSAQQSADLVLITGGLGPTGDDLTREGLAQALEDVLIHDVELHAQVAESFQRMNRPMTISNNVQAMRPSTSRGLYNSCGTAPGLAANWNKTLIFVMPGVPSEMRCMFIDQVKPCLPPCPEHTNYWRREVHFCGIGESLIGEALGRTMDEGADPHCGTRVHDGLVSVCFRSQAVDGDQRIASELQKLNAQFPGAGLSNDADSLPKAVFHELTVRQQTLAVAESCTGGMISSMLVDLPGISSCFKGGIIAYANSVKRDYLGVSQDILDQEGAVSQACVLAMADGVRKALGSDWGAAVSGIAGPDGGSLEKPVGLIWMAVVGPGQAWSQRRQFGWERNGIRQRAAWTTLDLIRRALTNSLCPDAECWLEHSFIKSQIK